MDKKQQNPTNPTETGLSSVQEQTAILLACGESITAVAEKMNVNRSTIYQWQELLTFQCFYNQQKQDIRENLRSEIFMLGEFAVDVLKDCLQSDNEQTRLKASIAILDRIEKVNIGHCSARNVLREKATYGYLPDDDIYFHEDVYQRLLNKNGLK